MKFTVEARDLSKALNSTKFVSFNMNNANKDGVKLTADKEAQNLTLICASTEGGVQLKQTIPADVAESGSTLLKLNVLNPIVKKADDTLTFNRAADENKVKIKTGNSRFNLSIVDEDDYFTPNFDLKEAVSCELDNKTFLTMIRKTSYAASKKETRPILCGVNFSYHDGTLTAFGTDSYRLSKYHAEVDMGEQPFAVTIPVDTLMAVETLTEDAEKIVFTYTKNAVMFTGNDVIIKSNFLSGDYPELDRLIPVDYDTIIEFDRKKLLASLDRTVFIKNDNMPIVNLCEEDNNIILTNRNQEIGESREVLDAKVIMQSVDPYSLSFNANYLIEVLKVMDTEKIVINFTGVMKPFVVTSSDSNELHLILPVRTYTY